MDFILEIVMEILVEGFLEGFVALVEGFFPKKVVPPKVHKILSVCLILFAVALAFASFVGVCLLVETGGRRSLGWWLVGAGAVYLALGVGLKFRAEIKKEKRGPEL